MAKKNITPNAAAPEKAPAPAKVAAPAKTPAKAASKLAPVAEAPVPPAAASVTPSAAPKKSAVKLASANQNDGANGASSNDIALRAYFISENRRLQGLPGDESNDWLEAERQIAAERGSAQKSGKR